MAGRPPRTPQGRRRRSRAQLKIHVLAIGKSRDADLDRLIAGYLDRCPWPVTIHELTPRKTETEADRLARALPRDSIVVALDPTGEPATSETFAHRLATWRDQGQNVTFLIGGADGLDPTLRATTHWQLAMGRLTWPHLLVRLLLAEQLYRASTILTGHPYHRG